MKLPDHPLLAVGKVRYVGEPVAIVVATSRYIARDVTDLIEVDYDPLDAVVDPEKAAENDSLPIHEAFGDNIAFRSEVANPTVDQALKEADKVIKLRIVQQRLVPMAMEPRATVAQWDRGTKQLMVWSATQIPHLLRTRMETFSSPIHPLSHSSAVTDNC